MTMGSFFYTYIHGSMTYLCWFLQRSALSKRILANFLVFGKEISTYRCIWRHFNAKDCSKIDILRCWLMGKCTENKVNMSIISFCQRAPFPEKISSCIETQQEGSFSDWSYCRRTSQYFSPRQIQIRKYRKPNKQSFSNHSFVVSISVFLNHINTQILTRTIL